MKYLCTCLDTMFINKLFNKAEIKNPVNLNFIIFKLKKNILEKFVFFLQKTGDE